MKLKTQIRIKKKRNKTNKSNNSHCYKAQMNDNNNATNDLIIDNSYNHLRGLHIAPLLRNIPEDHASALAIIYRSELDYLSRCIADYPDCETGGHLFGYWTAQGVPVILYATGPGPNCMHGNVECQHDHDYYNRIRNTLENTIALQHIGDWHSHHQLQLNHPSGGDVNAILAGVGNKRGMLRRHLMCIGTYSNGLTFLDAYTFHQNDVPDYMHAAWTIIEMESPFRLVSDKLLRGVLIHPRTQYPNMGSLYTINQLVVESSNAGELYSKLYWVDDSNENRDELKKLLTETKYFHPGKKVEVLATEDNRLFFSIGGGEKSILFTEPFPQGAPYYYNGDNIVQINTRWEYKEKPLQECFRSWLSQVISTIVSEKELLQEDEQDVLSTANDLTSSSEETEIKIDKDNETLQYKTIS